MKLKEKVIYFWNDVLGTDIEEEEDIATSTNPEYSELKESLARVGRMEQDFYQKSRRAKRENVVPKIDVDSKKIAEIAENQKTAKNVIKKDEEITK